MAEFIYSILLLIVDAYYSYVGKIGVILLRIFDSKSRLDKDNYWVTFALGNIVILLVIMIMVLVGKGIRAH